MADQREPSPTAVRIKSIREMAEVSARELDRLAELKAEGHTSLIESGVVANVRVDTLTAIARVFGVSLDWLVKGEGKEPSTRAVAAAVETSRAEHAARKAAGTGPHKVVTGAEASKRTGTGAR